VCVCVCVSICTVHCGDQIRWEKSKECGLCVNVCVCVCVSICTVHCGDQISC